MEVTSSLRLYVRRARDHRPGTATGGGPELDGALGLGARYTFPECRDPDPSLKRQIPRAAQVSIFGPEATLLPNRSNALRSSSPRRSSTARARDISSTQLLLKINLKPRNSRLVVESPLIHVEDVFVGCTRFLRMYIHRVSSRLSLDIGHHHSPTKGQGLLLTSKLAKMAKSQKKPDFVSATPTNDSFASFRRGETIL